MIELFFDVLIFFFFQLTFRIDIQQAKSIADSLIEFLDPWDGEAPINTCIIGIDLHVTGPAYAVDRVDDDIKCFLDFLLSGETYHLSSIDYRSWGPEWEEPETDIPNCFPSDFLFCGRREELGESTLRSRFSMDRRDE